MTIQSVKQTTEEQILALVHGGFNTTRDISCQTKVNMNLVENILIKLLEESKISWSKETGWVSTAEKSAVDNTEPPQQWVWYPGYNLAKNLGGDGNPSFDETFSSRTEAVLAALHSGHEPDQVRVGMLEALDLTEVIGNYNNYSSLVKILEKELSNRAAEFGVRDLELSTNKKKTPFCVKDFISKTFTTTSKGVKGTMLTPEEIKRGFDLNLVNNVYCFCPQFPGGAWVTSFYAKTHQAEPLVTIQYHPSEKVWSYEAKYNGFSRTHKGFISATQAKSTGLQGLKFAKIDSTLE